MPLKVLNIPDVVSSQLCCGCGACAGIMPDALEMVDVPDEGMRPALRSSTPNVDSHLALSVCPGVGLTHDYDSRDIELIRELEPAWGPVYQMWEGWSSDDAIRFAGSSGGAATALALYCLERMEMHGVLHTTARADKPHLNETVMSTHREELLARTGSRYAPASPAEGLPRIKASKGACVFIGKPCDVAGVANAMRLDPQLKANIGLTIGFFCAGTPSTNGTLAMLRRMGVDDPDNLISLRYRGNGWPGVARAVVKRPDGSVESRELSYEQSWGDILTRHVQWRCRVCADHTGEFADVAVGDPWYRRPQVGEPGRSLIVARTRRGRNIVRGAIKAGYLVAEERKPGVLPASQPNLLRTRGNVWGRVLASRLIGASAPRYSGMATFRFWLTRLSTKEKFQSIFGTVRRILCRRRRVKASQGAPEVSANVSICI